MDVDFITGYMGILKNSYKMTELFARLASLIRIILPRFFLAKENCVIRHATFSSNRFHVLRIFYAGSHKPYTVISLRFFYSLLNFSIFFINGRF